MSINFPAQPCTTLWEHLFYSRLNWWWKSLKMLMEQGVLTHACNPNTWGARVGEPGVHAPHLFFGSRLTEEEDLPIFSWRKTHPSRPPICFWKSSHGGRGPTSLLMEEASSFDSWKKSISEVDVERRALFGDLLDSGHCENKLTHLIVC